MVATLKASARRAKSNLEIISEELARKKGEFFNFNQEQWQEILQAVYDGCLFPSHFDAERVLGAVNEYLETISSYKSPTNRAAIWRSAAASLRRTRESLRKADPIGWATGPHGLLCDSANITPPLTVLDILDQWQKAAERIVRVSKDHGRFYEPHPRGVLFNAILDWWFEAGGRVTRSRGKPESRNAGQLGGPTVRFLQAVLRPVMKERMPKPEGLRRIIERKAHNLEGLLRANRDLAAYGTAYRVAACNGANKKDADTAGEAARRAVQKGTYSKKIFARRLVRGR
jgi:hypothetical protein